MKEKSTLNHYNQQAEKYYKQTVNVDLTALYPQFLKYLESKAHILDAGCGSGRDSLYFLEQGYQVTAVDAAKKLAQLAEDLIEQEVLKMRLEELNFNSEFDGIWACASLLHLSNEEIKKVLKNFTQALVAEGIIYISLKYGQQEEFRNGRFFNYHNEESWLNLMEGIEDLTIVELWQTGDLKEDGRDEKWLNVLLQKSK